jgi:hypothetical protein
VPVFLDSKASRLIQLADLVAFALFRFYEHGGNSFYEIIRHRFDSEGGVEHGLYVRVQVRVEMTYDFSSHVFQDIFLTVLLILMPLAGSITPAIAAHFPPLGWP